MAIVLERVKRGKYWFFKIELAAKTLPEATRLVSKALALAFKKG